MIRLVMWSGGPESTYVLMCALRDTEDEVIAVTGFTSMDGLRRVMAEKRTTRRLHAMLERRYRPFKHITYGLDAGDCGCQDRDLELHFLAMMVAFKHPGSEVFWGYCTDDIGRNREPALDEVTERIVRSHDMNLDITKVQIREGLGDLWSMTMSCAAPKEDLSPCWACRKCKERRAAE